MKFQKVTSHKQNRVEPEPEGFLWVNRFGNGLLIGRGNLERWPQAVQLRQWAGGGCVAVIISAIIDQTGWVARWSGMMDFMAPAQSLQLSGHKLGERRRKMKEKDEQDRAGMKTLFPRNNFEFFINFLSYLTLNSCSPGCVSISTRSPVRPLKGFQMA